MTVHDHDSRCCGHDGHAEHLARRNENRVESANRNQMVSLYLAAGVQQQNDKAFAVRVEMRMGRHMRFPISGGLLWPVADLHFFWSRTFPQGNQFPFLWLMAESLHNAFQNELFKFRAHARAQFLKVRPMPKREGSIEERKPRPVVSLTPPALTYNGLPGLPRCELVLSTWRWNPSSSRLRIPNAQIPWSEESLP
jgi:hypothetical protein